MIRIRTYGGYRISSSEQHRLRKVTGIRDGAVACQNRHAWHMACCAPIVVLWSGSSNFAGFPLSLGFAADGQF
jgi:hypothetical protein